MSQSARNRHFPPGSRHETGLALPAARGTPSPGQSRPRTFTVAALAVILFVVPASLAAHPMDVPPPPRGLKPAAAGHDRPDGNRLPFAEDARQAVPDAPVPPGDPQKPEADQPPQPPAAPGHAEPGEEEHPPEKDRQPEWKADLLKKMEKRVSFEFVDTPLADCVAFLSQVTGATIIADPAATHANELPITLKVNNMSLGSALAWIAMLARLDYGLFRQGIFISTARRLQGMPQIRVYDCRQLLNPVAQQELLDLIIQVTGADWHQEGAIMRFLDGRLVLRHADHVMEKATAFMDEFARASGDAATRAKPPEEPAADRPTKAMQELRIRQERELYELRSRQQRKQEIAKALALDPPKDFEQFWAGYSELMRKGRLEEAGLFCLLTAGVDTVMNAEGEKVVTRDALLQLVKDTERMKTLYRRAGDRLVGSVAAIGGFKLRIERFEDDRLVGRAGDALIGLGINMLWPEQVLEPGLAAEEDPKERVYQKALYMFWYHPVKAKVLLTEAEEEGLDMLLYQKLLLRRLEEAAKERQPEDKAGKNGI